MQVILYCSDGKIKVWRLADERYKDQYLEKTVKYNGGNIMVWGCFSKNGVGKLHFIEGLMDSVEYVNILANNLKHSAELLGHENWVFQQDNDPKHTSNRAKSFFAKKRIEVLEWPSQSPDLNPIEHLWAFIKSKLKGEKFKNKNDLSIAVETIWYGISKDFCAKLVDSMGKRIISCVRAKGKNTKY